MTEDNGLTDATRRFRRRVASGHARARSQYLTPELRAEAEALRQSIDKMFAKAVDPKMRQRVARIRDGATPKQSRRKNWRQRSLYDDDE